MPLITWSSKYSVGHSTIDTQHQKLVDLINELHEAMSKGKSKEVLAKIFYETLTYTDVHFTYEENQMKNAKYPNLPQHVVEHNKLTAQVQQYYEDFCNNKVNVSVELMMFLKNWLVNHIEGMDMRYKGLL